MPLEQRAKDWARQYREGRTLRQIAEAAGVSRQRVHQVLRPLEIAPPLPPAKVRMPSPKRGHKIWSVYVMAAPSEVGSVYFKVGITSDIVKRIPGVQTGCPLRITVVWAITTFNNSSAQSLETKMHALLSPYRAHGEWFAMDPANPQHKAAMNEAFAFAVTECSHMKPMKWRRMAVPRLREAVAAVARERGERKTVHGRDVWAKHRAGIDNWPE